MNTAASSAPRSAPISAASRRAVARRIENFRGKLRITDRDLGRAIRLAQEHLSLTGDADQSAAKGVLYLCSRDEANSSGSWNPWPAARRRAWGDLALRFAGHLLAAAITIAVLVTLARMTGVVK